MFDALTARVHHPVMTRRPSLLAALLLCAAALVPVAQAAEFPEKPPNTDFFVDKANLLDAPARQQVNEIASKLLREQRIPLFVVTVSSLSNYGASGLGVEGYARELFNHWGIGSETRNYGILLLVARGDRKARIELGAGYGRGQDGASADIMQNLIIPAFKREDYATGILDGVRGLDAMARGLALPQPTAPWWFLPALIGGAVLFVLMIINLFRSGRSGWAWALIAALAALIFFAMRNANSGGSAGGFGGGSSGGGGATGSW